MGAPANRKSIRIIAGLLTLAQASCQACEPWPEPAPIASTDFEYLVGIPNELDIHVDDATKEVEVWVLGKVYDTNHNPVLGEALQFSINPSGAGLDKAAVANDRTRLVVRVASGTPVDKDYEVTITHPASTLPPLKIPVHVRYAPMTVHGVAVPQISVDEWPMAGLASGEAAGSWHSNALRAFVRRGRFDRFDGNAVPPVGDLSSGTVLSSAHTLWRKPAPWAGTSGTMNVPNTTESTPATISLHPVFLSDDTPGSDGVLPSVRLVTDLQGGADIIETSLIGARVTIDPVVIPGPRLSWEFNCPNLADKVRALPTELQPHVDRLMVYMVDRSPAPPSNVPMECDPAHWGAKFPNEHAIFLPVGVIEPQSVAHEIGHALSLQHASWNGGFFHSNLMVEAISGMGSLRDRLSVGQAFRAALDKKSWLVLAGQNKSTSLDCTPPNPLCPKAPADILARVP